MVKIEILLKEGKVSRILELELARYTGFFEQSSRDNRGHAAAVQQSFPRWSIISGYYAMHDITKLLLAKKFRLKVEQEVHATTIKVLRELLGNRRLLALIERGYQEFLFLANDLEEAKKERVRTQYYTGTTYMKEAYAERARIFFRDVVEPYLEKMQRLLED